MQHINLRSAGHCAWPEQKERERMWAGREHEKRRSREEEVHIVQKPAVRKTMGQKKVNKLIFKAVWRPASYTEEAMLQNCTYAQHILTISDLWKMSCLYGSKKSFKTRLPCVCSHSVSVVVIQVCVHILFSFSTSKTCFFHSSKVGMSSLLGTDGSASLATLASPDWNTQAGIWHCIYMMYVLSNHIELPNVHRLSHARALVYVWLLNQKVKFML